MKKATALFLLIVSLLLIAGCGGDEPQTGLEGEPIKVGAIFDLTGPTSDVSGPYSGGMIGFINWKNQNGGVEGRPLQLISQDFAYKVPEAEQLYSQFVNQEGVVVFQGWGTGDTEALRGKIARDKIPFMSASYSIGLADINEAPFNFLAGTSYSDQMVIALSWILEQGGTKVALLHNDSPFGLSPLSDGEDFAAANGMEILAVPMPTGATDLTPQLIEIQSFGASHIIVQNVSGPAALALRNAKDLGLDIQFVMLNWAADELIIELAGDAAEGIVGTLPFTPPNVDVPGDDVIRAYLEAKGENLNDLGVHYAQGWYTMALMIEGVERVLKAGKELSGTNIRAELEKIENFDTGGISAPITFTPTDHRGNKSLRLFQVKDGEWVPISDYIESNIEITGN